MLTFEGYCPHCGSNRGFNAFGISNYLIEERDREVFPLSEHEKELETIYKVNGGGAGMLPGPQTRFSLAGECIKCHKPIVASCISLDRYISEMKNCIKEGTQTMDFKGHVESIYPPPAPPYAHPAIPEKIRVTFIDLQKMLYEGKQPHLIISGCRDVLDAAVRKLGGGKECDALYDRIEDLFKKNLITESLKDWANIIRKIGNKATHEMLGDQNEARELVDFTKYFLQYTFELPLTIQEKKS